MIKTSKEFSPAQSNFSQIMRRWMGSPLGIIILLGLVVLGAETLTMIFLFMVTPWLQNILPSIAFDLLDALILTLAVSPALYFLVFRRIQSDAEKFLKITGSVQDAIILMKNDGTISFWNKSAEDIFEYTSEEAVGQALHSLITPPEALNAFSNNFEHFQKTGRGPILDRIREVIAKRKSGARFYAELSVSALYLDGTWSAVGIVRDISVRKKQEVALAEQGKELAEINHYLEQEKLKDESIMESLGEGMIATDKIGTIIAINRAAEKIIEQKKEDVLGRNIFEAILIVDDMGNKLPKEQRPSFIVITSGQTASSQKIRLVQKGNGIVPVAVTATPVYADHELTGQVIIFRDITKDEELEETRRDLLSLASHQLRTPLSGTKWLIETLQKGIPGPLTDQQNEYLSQIYKVNEQMTELVHDMLGVLRLEGDTTITKREQVSLTALFGLIFETLSAAAKSKKISLQLEKNDEYTIETDPLFLREILETLISNAINYSNPGSQILVTIDKNSAKFIFTIKDSGIGIPRDEQTRIFERFYRATNAKTFDTRGTGLGLYIAKTLAKKMGGRVTFDSIEGVGSTFYLYIPITLE